MFRLGISSKLMQGYPLKEIIDYASATGFDGVELWMHQAEESGLGAREVKKLANDAKMILQVHMDTRDVNLASTNRAIREASLRQVLSAIDYAAGLEARVVTVHPGRITSEKEAVSRETLWNYQAEAFAELSLRAESRAIIIGAENMESKPNEFVLTEASVGKIIRPVRSGNLQATLDVAHLNSAGNVTKAIEAWRLPIANVHISQAGAKKMHLPIFSDPPEGIDYQQVFPLLAEKYRGMLVVEGYTRGQEKETIKKSYDWLISHTGDSII